MEWGGEYRKKTKKKQLNTANIYVLELKTNSCATKKLNRKVASTLH